MGTEVPHKVTTGARPTRQLENCYAELADLIMQCWEQRAGSRPDFPAIVIMLEGMQGGLRGAE